MRWGLNQNPFHFIEGEQVVAPVIKAGRAGALMVRHLLGDFELAAVAQIFGDPGRAEGVTTDLGFDAGILCPTLIIRYAKLWGYVVERFLSLLLFFGFKV